MCMYMNSIILLLILLNVLLLTMYKKPQYSLLLIVVTLLFVIMVIQYNSNNNKERFSNSNNNVNKWSIGPYSDLLLSSNKTEKEFPLLDPKTFGVYQADGLPLKDNKDSKSIDVKDMLDPYQYPTIDGSDNGLRSNFMFAYNQSSPLCCPSTFSTSNGCVCLTEDQKKLIGNRGTVYNK